MVAYSITFDGTDDALNVMDVFDPTTKHVLNEESDHAPSITSAPVGSGLWMTGQELMMV